MRVDAVRPGAHRFAERVDAVRLGHGRALKRAGLDPRKGCGVTFLEDGVEGDADEASKLEEVDYVV